MGILCSHGLWCSETLSLLWARGTLKMLKSWFDNTKSIKWNAQVTCERQTPSVNARSISRLTVTWKWGFVHHLCCFCSAPGLSLLLWLPSWWMCSHSPSERQQLLQGAVSEKISHIQCLKKIFNHSFPNKIYFKSVMQCFCSGIWVLWWLLLLFFVKHPGKCSDPFDILTYIRWRAWV